MTNPLKDISKRFDEELGHSEYCEERDYKGLGCLCDFEKYSEFFHKLNKEFISLLEGLKEEIAKLQHEEGCDDGDSGYCEAETAILNDAIAKIEKLIKGA